MAEIEEQIADAIVALLDTNVPELNSISFGKVRLSTSDIYDHEIPAVQMWDVAQTFVHQRGYVEVTWNIALELIMKTTVAGEVDQRDLWALRRKIELVLWDQPNLGIPGVIHLIYRNNLTDLHLLEPFYVARMEFDVLFRRQLTGSC